jgi:hypothetical protein
VSTNQSRLKGRKFIWFHGFGTAWVSIFSKLNILDNSFHKAILISAAEFSITSASLGHFNGWRQMEPAVIRIGTIYLLLAYFRVEPGDLPLIFYLPCVLVPEVYSQVDINKKNQY